MQNEISIDLLNPITGLPNPDGTPTTITRVVLRAPRLREYAAIGDLDSYAKTADGAIYMTENDGVFDRYISALAQEPNNPALLKNISLADAMRLKDALRDFFTKSRATGQPRPDASDNQAS
ncbi:hypothetical protein FB480_103457 [Agrobacterium vitis]|nr:hypothetical protein FB480_103457 [Agrobacterium vitis]